VRSAQPRHETPCLSTAQSQKRPSFSSDQGTIGEGLIVSPRWMITTCTFTCSTYLFHPFLRHSSVLPTYSFADCAFNPDPSKRLTRLHGSPSPSLRLETNFFFEINVCDIYLLCLSSTMRLSASRLRCLLLWVCTGFRDIGSLNVQCIDSWR
jgi:hypothetical protein